jgi:predicted Zn-dependent protease
MSKAQLANIGLGVGMMVDPGIASLSDLAQMGTQMLFLKFSRDDERQADELGMRYLVKDGYDPRESPEVFDMLRRVSAQSEGGGTPGWMSTHPDPENRTARMRQLISTSGTAYEASRVGRETFLRQIDGLVWGENPREGFFEDSRFIHPEMAFQLDFPDRWSTRNTKQMVGAVSPGRDAVIYLMLVQEQSLRRAADSFSRQEGVSTNRFDSGEFNGLAAIWTEFGAYVGQSPVAGRVAFVQYDGNIYRLLGYSSRERWEQYRSSIDRSVQSFARVRDRQYLTMQPRRLEIVKLDRGMTLREFDRKYPSTVPLDAVALINDASPDTALGRGDLVKRIVGGPKTAR